VDPSANADGSIQSTTTLDGSMAEEQTVQPEAAEEREERLDPETRARREAALRHVRVYGDPALRSRARQIEVFDGALADEVQRMGRLMDDALGIGLAATQLGVMHRLLVYRVDPEAPLGVLINPEIEYKSDDLETMEEGCLSLPGVSVEVERPIHVRVRAVDERGAPVVVEASGLEARVIQHEIDHLDGVLILDRTSRDQRKQAMRAMREGRPPDSSAAVSA
jgi:peptide deformylase